MTPRCKGCIAAMRGWASRDHTEECRVRMERDKVSRGDTGVARAYERIGIRTRGDDDDEQKEEAKRAKVQTQGVKRAGVRHEVTRKELKKQCLKESKEQ